MRPSIPMPNNIGKTRSSFVESFIKEVRQRLSGPYGAMLAWLKLDACYHRYRFNLTTGETKEERIEDLLSEFPVINNRYGGLNSKYSYHVTLADTDVILFDGI